MVGWNGVGGSMKVLEDEYGGQGWRLSIGKSG